MGASPSTKIILIFFFPSTSPNFSPLFFFLFRDVDVSFSLGVHWSTQCSVVATDSSLPARTCGFTACLPGTCPDCRDVSASRPTKSHLLLLCQGGSGNIAFLFVMSLEPRNPSLTRHHPRAPCLRHAARGRVKSSTTRVSIRKVWTVNDHLHDEQVVLPHSTMEDVGRLRGDHWSLHSELSGSIPVCVMASNGFFLLSGGI